MNGIRLHYVEAGSGPLVVLLHGFPEFWYGWRRQIPALARAGYRVIAPDLRGYNLSDKPAGLAAYTLDCLTDDVAALIEHTGEETAAVVGHDWGGVVAWALPVRHPTRVHRMAVLNSAPAVALARAILHRPRQLRRSWYILFFQIPGLAEAGYRAQDFRFLRRLLRTDAARPDSFTDEDIEQYVAALRRPGALTAMVNYYRAGRLYGLQMLRHPPAALTIPVLALHGMRDQYLGPELLDDLPAFAHSLRVVRFPDATHWVQHDEPERVNELLVEFLAEGGLEV